MEDYLVDKFTAMSLPNSGCELAGVGDQFAIFTEIFKATKGEPCGGCAYLSNCEFHRKIKEQEKQNKRNSFGKSDFKTNAEIAKERGISKRQVSKIRKEGKL